MNAIQNEKIIKSFMYASKTLIGAAICWYGLRFLKLENPIWAVITVLIVSDPILTTTLGLAKTRAVNTLVGCLFGMTSLFIFGYSPLVGILTASLTVLVVTYIERYPINWRLAPVTVIILMDAARQVPSHEAEYEYALLRMIEIGVGCAVALGLSGIYNWLFKSK